MSFYFKMLKSSLVMQELWQRYGKKDIGYTEADYANLVRELAGASFQTYFDNYIHGTAPLENALDEALHFVGCTLKKQQSPLVYESKFGFKISSDQHTKVTAVAPGSPASEALSVDDELIALNGRKLENNLQQLLALQPQTVELMLFRERQLRVVQLQPDGTDYYSKYTVEKRADATETAHENFKQWLKQPF